MQMLGLNTIRIYNLDPTLNHDDCVSIFNAVGIYMIIDVNSPLPVQSLDPGDLSGSYSSTYLEHIFGVIEAFKNYPNTLGFFGGNEVMNTPATGGTVPPYLRAVTRDLKDYIAKHSTRMIPVGYSAADVDEILVDSVSYLSCDIDGNANDPSRIDFFGINSYSWCGPTSPTANYQASSYDKIINRFNNTSIPIFFSEYGCNKVEPRVFDEVSVLYGNMTKVLSGGLVYQYNQETNNYGLVDVYDNQTASILIDYDNLQKQFKKLDIKALESEDSTAASIKSPTCGKTLITSNQFNNSFSLPSLPSGGQDLINNGIKNPPTGQIKSVTQTAVPASMTVYSSSGSVLSNLAIKPLPEDQSNTPNGQGTSGSTTSSSAKPSASKKGAAPLVVPTLSTIFSMLLSLLVVNV